MSTQPRSSSTGGTTTEAGLKAGTRCPGTPGAAGSSNKPKAALDVVRERQALAVGAVISALLAGLSACESRSVPEDTHPVSEGTHAAGKGGDVSVAAGGHRHMDEGGAGGYVRSTDDVGGAGDASGTDVIGEGGAGPGPACVRAFEFTYSPTPRPRMMCC
jgi:hypothetical protein